MKLTADMKMILKFGMPLAVSILLFVIVGKFGLTKGSEVRVKLEEAREDQSILTQKLGAISEVEQSILDSSTLASVAMPESNPLLPVISQVKTQSSLKGLFLTNIKTGSEASDKGGLKRIDVSFDIEGPRNQVMLFLIDIQRIAPISLLDKVKVNETSGVARANVTVRSFWSELPKTLPPATEPFKELSSDEISVLLNTTQLIQPTFIEIDAQEVTEVRPNPFSF